MKLHELLYIAVLVFLLIVPILFAYKFITFKRYVAKHKRAIPIKWLGYYDWIEITDTSSISRRKVMLRSNYVSNVLWGCILIIVILLGSIVKVLYL